MDARLQALELGMKRMASFGITAFQVHFLQSFRSHDNDDSILVVCLNIKDALIRGPNIQAYEAAIKDPKRFPLKFSLCLWWDFHHAKGNLR